MNPISDSPKIRIAINGFGRIGRTILRIICQSSGNADFDVALINDIEPSETCAYLFQYDSIYGPFNGTVAAVDQALQINGQNIPFHNTPDISGLDLNGIDVLIECTGAAASAESIGSGLAAGAGNVLISGPSDNAQTTIVLGVNERKLESHRIVSNASCTTNALAPLLKVLDDALGVESGQMTTVHCYTGSQPTVDKSRGNLARSRAASLSMVPTTTSAHRLVGDVLPHLKGRIEARAIRVPTASVSAIDLFVQTTQPTTVDRVNAILREASDRSQVIGWTDQPLVSRDLVGRPESIILSGLETSVSTGGLLRVFGWYDNEWGFSCRMLDVARLMASRH